MKHVTLFLIILFTIIPLSQAKDIYKWQDENGKVHFGDKKPANLAVAAIELTIINSVKSVSYQSAKIALGKAVKIYTTAWCGYCKKAKRYFKDNGIRYTEMNIETSSTAKRQFKKLGGKGVPLILVGTKKMSGFSEAGFERLYSPNSK